MHALKIVALMLLTATGTTVFAEGHGDLTAPATAIEDAKHARNGAPGDFVLTVKATGEQDRTTYLNSEPDYRDPKCLTVAIANSLAPDIERKLGIATLDELKERSIIVHGTAKQVKVHLMNRNGRDTKAYYYQTHVQVRSPKQIELAQ